MPHGPGRRTRPCLCCQMAVGYVEHWLVSRVLLPCPKCVCLQDKPFPALPSPPVRRPPPPRPVLPSLRPPPLKPRRPPPRPPPPRRLPPPTPSFGRQNTVIITSPNADPTSGMIYPSSNIVWVSAVGSPHSVSVKVTPLETVREARNTGRRGRRGRQAGAAGRQARQAGRQARGRTGRHLGRNPGGSCVTVRTQWGARLSQSPRDPAAAGPSPPTHTHTPTPGPRMSMSMCCGELPCRNRPTWAYHRASCRGPGGDLLLYLPAPSRRSPPLAEWRRRRRVRPPRAGRRRCGRSYYSTCMYAS